MCWQPLPDTSISLPTFKKDQLKPLEGNHNYFEQMFLRDSLCAYLSLLDQPCHMFEPHNLENNSGVTFHCDFTVTLC